jgi:polysaccharide export outer membrane protein
MRWALALAMLTASSLAACGAAPTYDWKAENALGYRVGAGDVLKISVWKHDELSQPTVTVRPDGAISLPLLGDVPAAGRSTTEISNDVAGRLRQFFQDQPPVTVQVAEAKSYRISVVGEVQKPGEFVPGAEVTILQSLALAAGFTRFANPDRIIVVRRDARGERRIPFDFSGVMDRGELQQNLALQPGDVVVVP